MLFYPYFIRLKLSTYITCTIIATVYNIEVGESVVDTTIRWKLNCTRKPHINLHIKSLIKNYMETEYINYNDEERFLTKFERESLKDWWIDGYADEYSLDQQEEKFNKWVEEINWSEIDEIMSHYTK